MLLGSHPNHLFDGERKEFVGNNSEEVCKVPFPESPESFFPGDFFDAVENAFVVTREPSLPNELGGCLHSCAHHFKREASTDHQAPSS